MIFSPQEEQAQEDLHPHPRVHPAQGHDIDPTRFGHPRHQDLERHPVVVRVVRRRPGHGRLEAVRQNRPRHRAADHPRARPVAPRRGARPPRQGQEVR